MNLEQQRLMCDRQEKSPVAYCRACGGEIYGCDDFYIINERAYCVECVESMRVSNS